MNDGTALDKVLYAALQLTYTNLVTSPCFRRTNPHGRVDTARLNSTESDAVVEDDRDTELLYRSAANLLCAAAPLVEAMPLDFLHCDTVNHSLHT